MIRQLVLVCLFSIPVAGQLVLEKTDVAVLGLRVSFTVDDDASSTGDGSFLSEAEIDQCGRYTLDPPPHNKDYFEAHLQAVDNYYRSVSNGNFGRWRATILMMTNQRKRRGWPVSLRRR